MSLVVFPFKAEDLDVIGRNLLTAASHPRIEEVWAVSSGPGAMMTAVEHLAREVASASGRPVRVFPQERHGVFRAGKGDGMNTAIAAAAERGFERTHFFDADITNFDVGWIDGAEGAADRGYGVVRHRFPRAATDAMITWMVTRPGLALRFPGTLLPRLGQPLGGEILLSAEAMEALAGDPAVRARSDWGIDTVITHATTLLGLGIYEHNALDGKRHALYGSLAEIEDMVLECLDAVIALEGSPTTETWFDSDPPAPVPRDLKETVAYDVEATRRSIPTTLTDRERDILTSLDIDPDQTITMDGDRWAATFPKLMGGFTLDDPDWRSVVFRLWAERVIHYTTHHVSRGYDHAIAYLEESIAEFELQTS